MSRIGLKFSQMILHTSTSKMMNNLPFLLVVLHKPTLWPSTFKVRAYIWLLTPTPASNTILEVTHCDLSFQVTMNSFPSKQHRPLTPTLASNTILEVPHCALSFQVTMNSFLCKQHRPLTPRPASNTILEVPHWWLVISNYNQLISFQATPASNTNTGL